jgi:serine/threonine protein kinase
MSVDEFLMICHAASGAFQIASDRIARVEKADKDKILFVIQEFRKNLVQIRQDLVSYRDAAKRFYVEGDEDHAGKTRLENPNLIRFFRRVTEVKLFEFYDRCIRKSRYPIDLLHEKMMESILKVEAALLLHFFMSHQKILPTDKISRFRRIAIENSPYLEDFLRYNSILFDVNRQIESFGPADKHLIEILNENTAQIDLGLVQKVRNWIAKFLVLTKPAHQTSPFVVFSDNFHAFTACPTADLCGSTIGGGSYGVIREYCIPGGTPLAIKFCKESRYTSFMIEGAIAVKNLFSRYFTQIDLVFDHSITMEKGLKDLNQLFKQYPSFVKGSVLKNFRGLLLGLLDLHNHDLTIGDINFTNILYVIKAYETGLNEVGGTLKFCDFDSITDLSRPKRRGTYLFCAPESARNPSSKVIVTKEANLWSIGVVLYGMITDGKSLVDFDVRKINDGAYIYGLLQSLTQDSVDEKVATALDSEALVRSILALKRRQIIYTLGRKQAHEKLIEIGKRFLEENPTVGVDDKRKDKDPGSWSHNQFLLELGIKKFTDQNKCEDLKNLFYQPGFEEYQKEEVASLYREELETHIAESMERIRGILHSLLQLDPSKRRSPKEIFEDFYERYEWRPDSFSQNEWVSLEELDPFD